MLSNRTNIGEAAHKGDSYPGEHDAIIDRETRDCVCTILQGSPPQARCPHLRRP
jgi:hypothetical protein